MFFFVCVCLSQKHHYHELDIEMRTIFGTIPREFTRYWVHRFPHLVSHSFHALQSCSDETLFSGYYNHSYTFAKPDYFFGADDEFVAIDMAHKVARESPVRKYAKDIRQRFVNRSNNQQQPVDEPAALNRRGVYNFKSDPATGDKSTTDGWDNWRMNRKKDFIKETPIAWTMPSSDVK